MSPLQLLPARSVGLALEQHFSNRPWDPVISLQFRGQKGSVAWASTVGPIPSRYSPLSECPPLPPPISQPDPVTHADDEPCSKGVRRVQRGGCQQQQAVVEDIHRLGTLKLEQAFCNTKKERVRSRKKQRGRAGCERNAKMRKRKPRRCIRSSGICLATSVSCSDDTLEGGQCGLSEKERDQGRSERAPCKGARSRGRTSLPCLQCRFYDGTINFGLSRARGVHAVWNNDTAHTIPSREKAEENHTCAVVSSSCLSESNCAFMSSLLA